jgi:cyclopropane fatty-acyl-phospholipid synthase-like methyltransferase
MAFEVARQKKCEIKAISLSKNQINYCKNKAKEFGLDTPNYILPTNDRFIKKYMRMRES